MEQTLPTRGEMERSLSQSIQAFYRNELGCSARKVTCNLIKNQLAVIIENSITPVEKLLNSVSDNKFMYDLRNRIDTIVKNALLLEIERILNIKVIDLTINTTLDHNFTGVVALLAEVPELRTTKNNYKKY